MVLTNFTGTGVGFGFGVGCGFGVGWGFGGIRGPFMLGVRLTSRTLVFYMGPKFQNNRWASVQILFSAGMPLNTFGLGAGGGCGVGLGLGWGFGSAFGSQYRSSRVIFQGIEFDNKFSADKSTSPDKAHAQESPAS